MKTEHSLAALCAAFEVTRYVYHAWRDRRPSARTQADAQLQADIAAIHATHRRRYGAPRIHAELQVRGRGTVANGLLACCARPAYAACVRAASCHVLLTVAMISRLRPTAWLHIRRRPLPTRSGSPI